MSGDIKVEMEEHQGRTSTIVLKKKDNIKSDKLTNIHPETSYEVFRNNTTAVEVIVKDVMNRGKKISVMDANDVKINRLQADVNQMHCELDIANKSLVRAKKGFLTIIEEMSKQIDIANLRESDTQAANLALKLENEKLRVLLDAKTKLLGRMKKEMSGMKRVLKCVVKCISKAPDIPKVVDIDSDSEYEDFENDLKNEAHLNVAKNMYDKSNTFDTTVSKDQYYFDKKCC